MEDFESEWNFIKRLVRIVAVWSANGPVAKLNTLNDNPESGVEYSVRVSSVYKVGERVGGNWN